MDVDLVRQNTRKMAEIFAPLRTQIEYLRVKFGALETLSETIPIDELIGIAEDALFCLELGLTLFEEANVAVQAGAWFAAATVAAAALEALLLALCFFHKDQIKQLPKWRCLKKSQRTDFRVFARSLDLGKLLEIAQELSWFPAGGVPKNLWGTLAPFWDELASINFLALFGGSSNIGQACANHLREYRNLIHPAVCLKQQKRLSKEVGMTATFLFMIAISSLSEGKFFVGK
jgi:hypothetical protein